MKRPLWMYAVAVLLIIAPASKLLAQYEEDEPSRVSLKVGLYKPSGSRLREGKSVWKTLGVDYNVRFDEMGRAKDSISLESSSVNENRFEGSRASIQYSHLWRGKSSEARGFYFGGGPGIFRLSEKALVEMPGGLVLEKHSGTKLGFVLIGGYDFSESWYAECRYNKISELATDVDFGGLAFYIGIRRLF